MSAASPPNVIVPTSSRSMRTASARFAPSASETGTRIVAPTETARSARGQPTSASSTTAPHAIATAVSTPHAGHCNRARAAWVFARWQRPT